jgi:hypothetical protein
MSEHARMAYAVVALIAVRFEKIAPAIRQRHGAII